MKEAWAVKPKDISADQIACTHYADIVIIGAGHAGTCAARAAAGKITLRAVWVKRQ